MTDDRDQGLEERRLKLEAELAQVKGERDETAGGSEKARGYRQAVKISSEFVSAVIVGALLGYMVDWLAGTSPWGMIVLLMLGFVAGVMNVLRTTGVVTSPHPADRIAELNRSKRDRNAS